MICSIFIILVLLVSGAVVSEKLFLLDSRICLGSAFLFDLLKI